MNNLLPQILFQDEHYLAVSKPAGLLVHPSLIDKHEKLTAVNLLQDSLQTKVFIIHRLDKPTSGIMLFALHQEAARKGMEAFAKGEIKKVYLAVVRGYTESSGTIKSSLPPVPDKLLAAKQKSGQKSKPAVTLYRTLAQVDLPVFINRHPTSRYSLLEVHPQTGRMHQIRRHLKQLRHPIIGDTKHGDHNHNRYFKENLACHRLLLSAVELSFFHPYRRSNITLTAPLDRTFTALLDRFAWIPAVPTEWLDQTSCFSVAT
jgi:tRNA pseudouridine65 synthase